MKEIEMLEKLKDTREKIIEEIHRVIVGQDEIIEKVLIGLFSDGHCLLVGVPGLAKTLMIRTLSRVLDLNLRESSLHLTLCHQILQG